jgi:drug/metabolite transporter (DMT)-like permease
MTPRVALALCFTLLTWASAFSAIRIVLRSLSPGAVTLYRVAVAAATLLCIAAVLGELRRPRREDLPRIIICGFLGGSGYHALLNYGQVTVEAGPASFLINTAPLFTAVFARIFLGERLRVLGWVGLVVSFCGVALIVTGRGKTLQFDPHALLVLAAAVCYSIFIVLQKRALEIYSVLAFSAYVLGAGALWGLVFAPKLAAEFTAISWQTHALVIYLGAVPAGLGYLCLTYVQAKLTASRAVSFLYLTPVIATIIAYFWLNEEQSVLALIGGGVVLLGVVIVNRFGRA